MCHIWLAKWKTDLILLYKISLDTVCVWRKKGPSAFPIRNFCPGQLKNFIVKKSYLISWKAINVGNKSERLLGETYLISPF